MRLYIFIICFTFFSCKEKDNSKEVLKNTNPKVSSVEATYSKKVNEKKEDFKIRNTQWIEVNKKGKQFKNLVSDWKREINVSENKILVELMEPSTYDLKSIIKKDDQILFKIQGADWYYRFKWEDKSKHISRWDYMYNSKVDSSFSYYTIQKEYRDKLK